jgi:hypothetical protein
MVNHLGESSNYTSTGEDVFWSLSEDEWIGSNFCLPFI